MSNFSATSWRKQVTFNEIMMIMSALYLSQHAELDFYSASSLKQQSSCRHVALLGHIILITRQPVLQASSLAEKR